MIRSRKVNTGAQVFGIALTSLGVVGLGLEAWTVVGTRGTRIPSMNSIAFGVLFLALGQWAFWGSTMNKRTATMDKHETNSKK
jgi:hypothetical protein